MQRNFPLQLFLLIVLFFLIGCDSQPKLKPGWPAISRETKPWTRWWWPGNALTKEGITTEMEAYQKAGLGGLEITPIYGVHGYESKFINYLSPEWMDLFLHTLKEAERLDMGIDMATGTGWPFGGPWVSSEDACKNMHYKIYELSGGEQLKDKIEFIQQPYLRAVGNQVYEVHQSFSTEPVVAKGTNKEPVMRVDPKSIEIKNLVDPIEKNKNLQSLAIDQVQFEKPLPLKVLMAYKSGEAIDLTNKVDVSGKLNWIPSNGKWKLLAVFEGFHGKMVERAAPGAEGNVIDHFSLSALQHYLKKFDDSFSATDISSLRSFFNDSYEVDDARGAADFTPLLFEEFEMRRGYDLKAHLFALFGQGDEEKYKRILCDYRETISELLLENFTTPWRDWAHSKNALVRNQAHGSPANILDLYVTVDIPEIEGVEPLRIKFASSAGNVSGKKLVSSESATWLNEHFESNLSDIKVALDRFMLNGVNHIFYHGTAYSPPNEPWPGWLFYAAVHLNPRNPLWKDFDALNEYVSRCQSFLQSTAADNDVLLYYPIYDRFSAPGPEMVEHFDGLGKQFENTAFERSAKSLMELGYAFDYVSDKQIEKLIIEDGKLKSEGGATYQAIVIPRSDYIPSKTFHKLVELAESGAILIFSEGLPNDVPGYFNLEENRTQFRNDKGKIIKKFVEANEKNNVKFGTGKIFGGDSLSILLKTAGIRNESLKELGIDFIRKKETDGRTIYLIANNKNKAFESWLPLSAQAESVVLYDPMTGRYGKAKTKNNSDQLNVFVRLNPKETVIIETYSDEVNVNDFIYNIPGDIKIALNNEWKIKWISGGSFLPKEIQTNSLKSWTLMNDSLSSFSGTASYKTTFAKPKSGNQWILDLGVVKETAEVFLNGKSIGTLIGPTFQMAINESDLKEDNELEIQVSNLMANRIADLDKRNVFWKKFYNVNFPARKSENRKDGIFDASGWTPRESGLIGPVVLRSTKTD